MKVTEDRLGFNDFINDWKSEFIIRAKSYSRSTKILFGFNDAVKFVDGMTNELDQLMVNFIQFINNDPLSENDYYKYVAAYRRGKKLDLKYFRHNEIKLKKYYRKIDDNKNYNPFSWQLYKKYVLFMMLKLKGFYKSEYDKIFNVTYDKHREYNPLTKIPSVLRANLPMEIKEFDIVQAYPSFIFEQLNIKPFDVYQKIEKQKFNTLLNCHRGIEGLTIEKVRSQLKPIFGKRTDEIITKKRFDNKGKLFEEFSAIEEKYIQKFVESNALKNFVRLHDGVVTLKDQECEILDFGIVKFRQKSFTIENKPFPKKLFYKIKNNEIKTSPALYKSFFEQEGFLRITQPGIDEITILKNSNRIVRPINYKTDLVPFLKENINEVITDPIEDRIAFESNRVIIPSLLLLKPIPLKYHKDTKDRCDFPFKNGIVRVTAESIKLISYDEIDGFFAEHPIQKRTIELQQYKNRNCDFEKFVIMAATNKDIMDPSFILTEADHFIIRAFNSMIGYLLSNYKDPANSPAIVLTDENADGKNRDGGRGKSLIQTALTYFRNHIYKGGNSYDSNYTFIHSDLKKEHDIYILDDVPKNFNYDALYTNLTGSISAQRKQKSAEVIPFEDVPKFIISSNWVLRYDEKATSTNRRFREYKFTDFFNINNTPQNVFKKKFFEEWTKEEWNSFYHYGFYCVQVFLQNGLVSIDYDKRKDNFHVMFYNDAILEEMERLMQIMSKKDGFTVTDFLEEHKRNFIFSSKPLFHQNNSKKYIDTFISFRNLPFKYSLGQQRFWQKIK